MKKTIRGSIFVAPKAERNTTYQQTDFRDKYVPKESDFSDNKRFYQIFGGAQGSILGCSTTNKGRKSIFEICFLAPIFSA